MSEWVKPSSMAWNYKTGREEDNPYPHGNKDGIYTPPPWKPEVRRLVMDWERDEAFLARTNNKFMDTWEMRNESATKSFRALERALVSQDEIPEFRRRYMEWLATHTTVTQNQSLGFMDDLTMDQLPILDRIVQKGYRELARTEHPDLGGDAERFNKLQQAKVQLMAVLRELKEIL